MLHPSLAIDAETSEVYGFSHIRIWHREDGQGTKHSRDYQNLPIEEKESNKWLDSSYQSIKTLSKADMVTIVEDREGDIYQQFCDVPRDNVHLLVRNSQNRRMLNGERLHGHLGQLSPKGTYKIEIIQTLSSKQQKRTAELEVRFDKVSLLKPDSLKGGFPESVDVFVIEAREINNPAKPGLIHWRLLTTHEICTLDDALTAIGWYSKRWYIEQVFRLLKKKGFHIENSELESGWAVRKLTVLAMQSALAILQMRLAQQAESGAPATRVFTAPQIDCLKIINVQHQGNTEKQKNPYKDGTLIWAVWVIARLGGWKGYGSQRPPGLITLKYGLDRFEDMYKGFIMINEEKDVYTP